MTKNTLSLFMLLALIAFSCSKEEFRKKNSEGTPPKQVKNELDPGLFNHVSKTPEGYLHFSSPESFDQAMELLTNASDDVLDGFETTLNFTSSYTFYGIKNAEETGVEVKDPRFKNTIYEDPMILRITDYRGIIQIGDYLFKLELDNRFILQMYAEDKAEHFETFSAGTFNPQVMNKLDNASLSEEGSIWDQLGEHPVGLVPMAGLFTELRDLWGSRYVEEGVIGIQNFRCKFIGSYQNVVFYRSIITKFQYWHGSVPVRTVMNVDTGQSNGWIEWKNGDEAYRSPDPSDFQYDGSYRYERKWRMYEGSLRVHEAYVNLYVSYEDRNDGVMKNQVFSWQKYP